MNAMSPVKCPECGTWWRGMEHRCGPASPPNAKPVAPHGPKEPSWWPRGNNPRSYSGGASTTAVSSGVVRLVNNLDES